MSTVTQVPFRRAERSIRLLAQVQSGRGDPTKKRHRFSHLPVLLLLTVFAILIQGYHPGAEDDGVYLPAIKQDLNPHLFPHNPGFFRIQMQATIFDKVIAGSVRATHLPLAWAILIWQFAAILLILWGCLRIARLCFADSCAQWSGVAMVATLLAIPVSNTGLYLVDENLHPRAIATAAILWAITAALERRWWLMALLLAIACAFHPIMGPLGVSYCLFLAYCQRTIRHRPSFGMAAFMPLTWIFDPASTAWHQAQASRNFQFLSRWTWYEWLGVFAPMLLLWWFSRIGRRSGSSNLQKIGSSLVFYSIFQITIAFAMMGPITLERLRPLQPMRYLHIVYLLLALLGGGLIGQKVLRRRLYRWLILFVPLSGGMFYAQSRLYPKTEHLELPGRPLKNNWLKAFAWIKTNTPEDSYFAIDPYYLAISGEDVYGFRALAERSVLADAVKDPSVVTQVPELGPAWRRQIAAETGWKHFQVDNFEKLRAEFGVTWVVVQVPVPTGLECPYQNPDVAVCRIPTQTAYNPDTSTGLHIPFTIRG